MAVHEVTGPLAVVKDANGKLGYYYNGAVLPEDVPADVLERLVAVGLVAPVKVDVAKPDPATRPADSANKAAWVEHAVARGMDRADATKLSREQLIEATKPAPAGDSPPPAPTA